MKDKTYGIDAEAELMKILNKQTLNSNQSIWILRKDWRKMKIKKIFNL